MDFPFGGFDIVAKDPTVEGRRLKLTRLKFVEEARWVWLQKSLQLKIMYRLRDSN